MSTTTVVNNVKQPAREVPFLLRVIWFFLLGWQLAAIWILAAWFLNLTLIGLPLGLWMLNRVPQVLTLKARPGMWDLDLSTGHTKYVGVKQRSWLIRAVYFVFIGWWFSLLWSLVGWLLCLTIIGLPFGVLMLNRIPAVTTLQRG